MPFGLNRFGGWLNCAGYFFFWNYHWQNAVSKWMLRPDFRDLEKT